MQSPTRKFWHSNSLKTGLMLVFIGSLIAGVLAGELTLIRIESATL
jgi:hypothetical protein